jgi:drug/metabolite transporter (DMT)-like permease
MNGRSNRWAAALAVVFVAAVVGYGAYNLGLSHGLAVNGSLIFFPFFFFAFWFVVARAFFWRGPWRRHHWRGDGLTTCLRCSINGIDEPTSG